MLELVSKCNLRNLVHSINVEHSVMKNKDNHDDSASKAQLERLNTELESRQRFFEQLETQKEQNLLIDTLTFRQLISDICTSGQAVRITDHRSNTTSGHIVMVGKDFLVYSTFDGAESIYPQSALLSISPILRDSVRYKTPTTGKSRPKLSMLAFLDSTVPRDSFLKIEYRFEVSVVQGRFLGSGAEVLILSHSNTKEPIFIPTPQIGSVKILL